MEEHRKRRASSITGPKEHKVVKHTMKGAVHKKPAAKPVYKQRLAKPEADDMPHKGKKYHKLKGVMI